MWTKKEFPWNSCAKKADKIPRSFFSIVDSIILIWDETIALNSLESRGNVLQASVQMTIFLPVPINIGILCRAFDSESIQSIYNFVIIFNSLTTEMINFIEMVQHCFLTWWRYSINIRSDILRRFFKILIGKKNLAGVTVSRLAIDRGK